MPHQGRVMFVLWFIVQSNIIVIGKDRWKAWLVQMDSRHRSTQLFTQCLKKVGDECSVFSLHESCGYKVVSQYQCSWNPHRCWNLSIMTSACQGTPDLWMQPEQCFCQEAVHIFASECLLKALKCHFWFLLKAVTPESMSADTESVHQILW